MPPEWSLASGRFWKVDLSVARVICFFQVGLGVMDLPSKFWIALSAWVVCGGFIVDLIYRVLPRFRPVVSAVVIGAACYLLFPPLKRLADKERALDPLTTAFRSLDERFLWVSIGFFGALVFLGIAIWGRRLLSVHLKTVAIVAPSSHAEAPSVLLSAEHGHGKAVVRVQNVGIAALDLTASARVIDIREQAQNPKFLRTYALRWASSDQPQHSLGPGAADSLLVASCTVAEQVTNPRHPHILELRLEGFEAGNPTAVHSFRCRENDKAGAVTATLEITVSSLNSSLTKRFSLTNQPPGGLWFGDAAPKAPDLRLSIERKINQKTAAYLVIQNLGSEDVEVHGLLAALSGINLPAQRLMAQWEDIPTPRITLSPGKLHRIVVARYHTDSYRYQWNIPAFRQNETEVTTFSTELQRTGYSYNAPPFELRVTILTNPALAHPFYYDFSFRSEEVHAS